MTGLDYLEDIQEYLEGTVDLQISGSDIIYILDHPETEYILLRPLSGGRQNANDPRSRVSWAVEVKYTNSFDSYTKSLVIKNMLTNKKTSRLGSNNFPFKFVYAEQTVPQVLRVDNDGKSVYSMTYSTTTVDTDLTLI